MNPRINRLQADEKQVRELLVNQPKIELLETEGEPPERYLFRYDLASITGEDRDQLVESRGFEAEIYLPLDYPRRPPVCRMRTPIFHPNIDPQKICIGDHWSAGQRLVLLVTRIGEMIAYQSYNVKSPLNAEAALWAQDNTARLPIEEVDLSVGL